MFARQNGECNCVQTTEAIGALFDFDPENLLRPPEAIAKFVQRMVRNAQYYDGPEQRLERRYAVNLPVTAVPVDRSLQKSGEVFVALTRDISSGGIAMYHTRDVAEKFLALELIAPSGDKLRVLLEVLRCRPAGLFYEIAGRFVSKLLAN